MLGACKFWQITSPMHICVVYACKVVAVAVEEDGPLCGEEVSIAVIANLSKHFRLIHAETGP